MRAQMHCRHKVTVAMNMTKINMGKAKEMKRKCKNNKVIQLK